MAERFKILRELSDEWPQAKVYVVFIIIISCSPISISSSRTHSMAAALRSPISNDAMAVALRSNEQKQQSIIINNNYYYKW
jgi:hypothetical protein